MNFCVFWLFLLSTILRGAEGESEDGFLRLDTEVETTSVSDVPEERPSTPISERFTAPVLPKGALKLGLDVAYGVCEDFQIGLDMVNLALGVPLLRAKYLAYQNPSGHLFSIGLESAFLRKYLLQGWMKADRTFLKLEATVLKPRLVWTQIFSQSFSLHSMWAKGVGDIKFELSEEAKREYMEATPGETRTRSQLSERTLEVQSLFGLATDYLRISGEFTRASGHKVFLSSAIEKLELGGLRGISWKNLVSHHSIYDHLHFRLGVGLGLTSIFGTDLDGAPVDQTRVHPVAEAVFYVII